MRCVANASRRCTREPDRSKWTRLRQLASGIRSRTVESCSISSVSRMSVTGARSSMYGQPYKARAVICGSNARDCVERELLLRQRIQVQSSEARNSSEELQGGRPLSVPIKAGEV